MIECSLSMVWGYFIALVAITTVVEAVAEHRSVRPFRALALSPMEGYDDLMLKEAIPHFAQLSSSEKLLLLEELWDDMADHPSEVPVPDWQKRELERRYREFLQNPSEGSPWPEVRERLLRIFQ